jgi:hypothetical protein
VPVSTESRAKATLTPSATGLFWVSRTLKVRLLVVVPALPESWIEGGSALTNWIAPTPVEPNFTSTVWVVIAPSMFQVAVTWAVPDWPA